MTILPDTKFLHRLADAADQETLPRFRTSLSFDNKAKRTGEFDPVTTADREAERVVRELISSTYPDHAIVGEEFGVSGTGQVQWALDPVDGTKPFLCGIPVYGTLIGVAVHGRAHLGVLSQPFTGERFWADAAGAWQRGPAGTARLSVSSVTDLSEAILHTTSPEPLGVASGVSCADCQSQDDSLRRGMPRVCDARVGWLHGSTASGPKAPL
jgi:fructose-1,6-bisphosphatase/inositol monophosphatase family enzyme